MKSQKKKNLKNMKSQQKKMNKSQKKWNLKKKWKQKILRTIKFKKSINVSVRQCQDLVNVRIRECQSPTIGAEHKLFYQKYCFCYKKKTNFSYYHVLLGKKPTCRVEQAFFKIRNQISLKSIFLSILLVALQ